MGRKRIMKRHAPAAPKTEASDTLLAGADGSSSLARRLADVEKQVRDEAVADVRSWLRKHRDAKEGDYLRLWKALWYCMWLADKPPVQIELADVITGMLREIAARSGAEGAAAFASAFFSILRREWTSLDRWRMDKYRALTRRVVAALLHAGAVDLGFGRGAVRVLVEPVLGSALGSAPDGARAFVLTVLFEEVCRAAPEASTAQLRCLLRPLYRAACTRAGATGPAVPAAAIGCLGRFADLADTVAGAGSSGGAAASAYPLHATNFAALAWDALALASSRATATQARAPLYSLHERMAAAAAAIGCTYRAPDDVPAEVRGAGEPDAAADEDVDGVRPGAWPVVLELEAAKDSRAAGKTRPGKRGREAPAAAPTAASAAAASSSSSSSSSAAAAASGEPEAKAAAASKRSKRQRRADKAEDAAAAPAEGVSASSGAGSRQEAAGGKAPAPDGGAGEGKKLNKKQRKALKKAAREAEEAAKAAAQEAARAVAAAEAAARATKESTRPKQATPGKKGKKGKKPKAEADSSSATPEASAASASSSSSAKRRVRISSNVDALSYSDSVQRLRRSARLAPAPDATAKPVLKPSPAPAVAKGKAKRAGRGRKNRRK